MAATFAFDDTVDRLKALAEPTRLRLVALLACSDLTVTDLVSILGQSQPRISRHLKLLVETGVLTRYQEGAWAYFRLAEDAGSSGLAAAVLAQLSRHDPVLERDAEKLEAVRRQRAERAAEYFARNAERWDRIRSLHVADAEVEDALLAALGRGVFESVLDIGTGTGRMLELFAPHAARAVGVDASREMLALARAKLDAAGLSRVSVRQGDAYHLPFEPGSFDLVLLHQVLHHLDDPAEAVREAARTLEPGGQLAIVDFAPHAQEFLRQEHAHLRLGFSQAALAGFLEGAGLFAETSLSLEAPGEGQLTVTITVGRLAGISRSALRKTA
ncbi:ArsR/SmtB family transcription factor [Aureimonas populi]|uniref:ArsR/SmtB family transcription factor n=1 Tax=Aureimonas populi TaxID=1701758 RepID=A0ABW5CJA6_9HYPH|nr:metalloregulator ArsR/SmtB family transcription factor [Aureimonas populi]